MKVLIVDDEPAMLMVMNRLLSRMEDVEISGSFLNAEQALAFVKEWEVDIAFVDIKIAGDNGLELARRLRAVRVDLEIVFVTSHTEFALDAFDTYPLDYMVKPISRGRLAQTIARAAGKRSGFSEAAAEAPNRLIVRCLGCINASSKQAGEVKWMSQKSLELFAYLLVNRKRSVAKSRILEDIFSDMPLKNAEAYLHTAVYQLRKALSPHGLKSIVGSAHEQYRLDLGHVDVDFIDFENGVAGLTEINAFNEVAAIELEQRYSGDLFEVKSFMWALAERMRLADLYDAFAKRLTRCLLAQQKLDEALPIAKKIVSFNELDKEANFLLLSIYGTMKKDALLKWHYERYTQLLHYELGVTPPPEITLLYEQYQP
jgi:two-component SAPR family response regulator